MPTLQIKKEILLTFFLVSITFLILPHVWIATLLLLGIFIWFLFGSKDLIIPLIIISLLVITSDISESLRVVINFLGYLILLYLFVRDYGLDFSNYPKVPAVIVLFVIFTILSLSISTVFSSYFSLGIIEILRQTVFFVLIFIVYSFIKGEKEIYLYLNALIFSGTIIGLLIIDSFIKNSDIYILETQGLTHEGGYINNVAAAGGIFAISISINLAFLFLPKFKESKYKLLLFTTLFIQIIALLVTNSRAAFLAAFVSGIYILFKLNKKILKILSASLISFAILIIAIFPKVIDVISTFFRFNRVFENLRYLLWDIAFGIIKDNPIFGIGPGTFKFYIYKYLPVQLGSWNERSIYFVYKEAGTGHAHNFWLYRFSELGIFGFIGAVALPCIFFYLIHKIKKNIKLRYEFTVIITAITGSILGLLYRSMFESTGFLTNGWITRDLPFWILFLIVIYFYQNFKNTSNSSIS